MPPGGAISHTDARVDAIGKYDQEYREALYIVLCSDGDEDAAFSLLLLHRAIQSFFLLLTFANLLWIIVTDYCFSGLFQYNY